uniref:Uncharacterized protein n=1 Tax=Arundo donax TaxID=35708 RepID=A0A0A9HIV0_ARUDO
MLVYRKVWSSMVLVILSSFSY